MQSNTKKYLVKKGGKLTRKVHAAETLSRHIASFCDDASLLHNTKRGSELACGLLQFQHPHLGSTLESFCVENDSSIRFAMSLSTPLSQLYVSSGGNDVVGFSRQIPQRWKLKKNQTSPTEFVGFRVGKELMSVNNSESHCHPPTVCSDNSAFHCTYSQSTIRQGQSRVFVQEWSSAQWADALQFISFDAWDSFSAIAAVVHVDPSTSSEMPSLNNKVSDDSVAIAAMQSCLDKRFCCKCSGKTVVKANMLPQSQHQSTKGAATDWCLSCGLVISAVYSPCKPTAIMSSNSQAGESMDFGHLQFAEDFVGIAAFIHSTVVNEYQWMENRTCGSGVRSSCFEPSLLPIADHLRCCPCFMCALTTHNSTKVADDDESSPDSFDTVTGTADDDNCKIQLVTLLALNEAWNAKRHPPTTLELAGSKASSTKETIDKVF